MKKEYVSSDGEVFEDAEASAKALTDLASFKFQTYETAAADPKLADTKALQTLVVYLSFVTIDERTLKPTPAYASNMTLKVRGGIKNDSTAMRARNALIDLGYLVPTDKKSRDGALLFHVRNPRAEIVQMHMTEAREYWLEKEAERKKEKRRRRALRDELASVPAFNGGDITPRVPTVSGGDVPTVIAGDSLKDTLDSSRYEGKDTLKGNSYKDVREGETLPFPIPMSDSEGDHMMEEIFSGIELSPAVYRYFRIKLFRGNLTMDDVVSHEKAFAA